MSNFTLLGCLEVEVLWLETKKTNNNKFDSINGFLSLLIKLSFKVGLRLWVTKMLGFHEPAIGHLLGGDYTSA